MSRSVAPFTDWPEAALIENVTLMRKIVNRYRDTLVSIAANTCCHCCGEAAKWATKALRDAEKIK